MYSNSKANNNTSSKFGQKTENKNSLVVMLQRFIGKGAEIHSHILPPGGERGDALGQVGGRRLGLRARGIQPLRHRHGFRPVGLHEHGERLSGHSGHTAAANSMRGCL
jgi:hypothetical protein